jgi:hypothetical protein
VPAPLRLAVTVEHVALRRGAQVLDHAGDRIAKEIAVVVELARQIVAEDAPHGVAVGAGDGDRIGADARPLGYF